jgi:hypothetical protein
MRVELRYGTVSTMTSWRVIMRSVCGAEVWDRANKDLAVGDPVASL